ncbi:MAG TPA: hypothetical protein VGR67_16225 [Candidatus Polarisedimenticolia bacterium]|nr:hypothetical protein [Candidatus Polarisedimenticolia bacterium]
MRTRWVPAILLGFAALAPAEALAQAEGNVNVQIGLRTLDREPWGEVDDQWAWGVQADFGSGRWPVHVQVGLHASEREKRRTSCFVWFCDVGGVELKGTLQEASLGVVKIWSPGERVRPFLGAGGEVVNAELKDRRTGVDHEETSAAAYAAGGVFWQTPKSARVRLNSGVEAKIVLGAHLKIDGAEESADYYQLAYLIGVGW